MKLAYNGSNRIVLQTPAMRCPFGVSSFAGDGEGKNDSKSLDMSFANDYQDPSSTSAIFLAKLREIDDWMLDVAVANSTQWFGKSITREVLAEFYRPLCSHRNPEYPPMTRVKVPTYALKSGQPAFTVFSEQREKVELDAISRGSVVRCIVEVSSVWFLNKTFGVSLKLVQAAIVSSPSRMDEYAFAADGEEEDAPAIPAGEFMMADE